jgi:hypothetical protein
MTDVVVIAKSQDPNDRLASALQGIAQVGNRCPECDTLLSRRIDVGGTWEDCPVCGFSRMLPADNRLARIGKWEEYLDAQDRHEEVTL